MTHALVITGEVIGLVVGTLWLILGVTMLVNRITPAQVWRNLREEFGSSTPTTRAEADGLANVVRTTGGTGAPYQWRQESPAPHQWRQESPYQIFHPAEPPDRTAQMIAEQDQRYEAWRNSRARIIEDADEADLELDPPHWPVPEFEERGDIPEPPTHHEQFRRLLDRYDARNRASPRIVPPGDDPF
jgi:hypothetical protein